MKRASCVLFRFKMVRASALIFLAASFCKVPSASGQASAVTNLSPFIENVVLVYGTNIQATGVLVDCLPSKGNKDTASCVLLTAKHVVEGIKGPVMEVDLRGRKQGVPIREYSLSLKSERPDKGPISQVLLLELLVDHALYPIQLQPETNTLAGIRDGVNNEAPSSGVRAEIVNLGDAQAPVYVLQIYPMVLAAHPDTTIVLRAAKSNTNLIVEHTRWTTLPDPKVDLAVMPIAVTKNFLSHRLALEDFADANDLKQLDAGDPIRCVGFGRTPTNDAGYGITGQGIISSYPFPPPREIPVFNVEASIAPGESGGPCMSVPSPGKSNIHSKVIGVVSSQLLSSETDKWSFGSSVHLVPTGVNQLVKSTLARELFESFEKTWNRP